MKAALIISHGSRSSKTKEEIDQLVKKLKQRSKISIIEYGFLELESPSISEGIENCVSLGASEVVVVLNFLNSGRHVDQDIPGIVNESQRNHPNVKIRISSPVGQHPKIVDLFIDLIEKL